MARERPAGNVCSIQTMEVVATFALVGFLTAIPPLTSLLFVAVGTLTFIVCPASFIAVLHNPQAELGWKFFATLRR